MVVPNGQAEAAMKSWGQLGVGPFLVLRNFEFQNYRYRGKPAPAPIVSLAFGQSGSLQVEIIEQHNDAPSAYTEFLATGQKGCQHVAEWFDDSAQYDKRYTDLVARGFVC